MPIAQSTPKNGRTFAFHSPDNPPMTIGSAHLPVTSRSEAVTLKTAPAARDANANHGENF